MCWKKGERFGTSSCGKLNAALGEGHVAVLAVSIPIVAVCPFIINHLFREFACDLVVFIQIGSVKIVARPAHAGLVEMFALGGDKAGYALHDGYEICIGWIWPIRDAASLFGIRIDQKTARKTWLLSEIFRFDLVA